MPRRSARRATAAARGLWRPSIPAKRHPQSRPAHHITQSVRIIAGSGATITRPTGKLCFTSANAPPATTEALHPEMVSSSTGWLAISSGVSTITTTW